ncbi:MAG: cytochrome c oxidase subunit 3 [Chitinophagales bacterium]|nr:cytochrome c oxidase subunit 3 [Chitinophagales bacterium]
MNTAITDNKNIFYPPGGILLWIIIFIELITFGAGLISMIYYGNQEPDSFHSSRSLLNASIGMANTIILLTSGFFMALSVKELKVNNQKRTKQYLLLTMLLGSMFLVLKLVEYSAKIDSGLVFGYNTFFNFYWMLTIFHFLHVLVGLVILISLYFGIRKEQSKTTIGDFESGAAFWHMCDLIWLLLFPIIYLIN